MFELSLLLKSLCLSSHYARGLEIQTRTSLTTFDQTIKANSSEVTIPLAPPKVGGSLITKLTLLTHGFRGLIVRENMTLECVYRRPFAKASHMVLLQACA